MADAPPSYASATKPGSAAGPGGSQVAPAGGCERGVCQTFLLTFDLSVPGGRRGLCGGEGPLHLHPGPGRASPHDPPRPQGAAGSQSGPGGARAAPQVAPPPAQRPPVPARPPHPVSLLSRRKQQGSRVLTPVGGPEGSEVTVQEVAEAGRATLWCQVRTSLRGSWTSC